MPSIAELGEFGLIKQLSKRVKASPHVLKGIGDDAAVIANMPDCVILATCDAQAQDIHFRLEKIDPVNLGWRAMAVNISDIAAMGGKPWFALISLLAPAETDVALLDNIYIGLQACAETYGAAIAGGNVSRIPNSLIIDITLVGMADAGALLLRSGAKAGDSICVTGTVGLSAIGRYLQDHPSAAANIPEEMAQKAILAHHKPMPRVAAGQWLAAHKATSAIDISDGFASDIRHICEASHVGALIEAKQLPISAEMAYIANMLQISADEFALSGGEDYELLFTLPAEETETALKSLSVAADVPVTKIGVITEKTDILVVNDGKTIKLDRLGWDHLSGQK